MSCGCHSTHTPCMQKKLMALVGNPNCGKSTLFNALCGAKQHIGNWPGVTVERASGVFSESGNTIEVVDLPGTYSLTLMASQASLDESIACDFVLQTKVDVIVNLVDASALERHLYLTLQLLEMGLPVIVALNMTDIARARDLKIDVAKLSRQLGCPVVSLEANKGVGIEALKQAVRQYDPAQTKRKKLSYPPVILNATQAIMASLPQSCECKLPFAIRLLEADHEARQMVSESTQQTVEIEQRNIQSALQEEADILIADTRYREIQTILSQCQTKASEFKTTWTTRMDRIVLNRILGIPIFLGVMYVLFAFAIGMGSYFQTYFDTASQAVFVDGVSQLLVMAHAPEWLTGLLANGVGKGLNTVITFIPVIGSLFLFLALLEDSGYMARAAFIVDRVMRTLGLPGKAFVPMIVGFGCNVPAVMAARTLEHKRDRILTIMMTPFMSCSARLAIYAVFTAAFFPQGGQNVVFGLYCIGVLMAILTGFMLRRTVLPGESSPLIMELPAYHVPQLKTLLLHAWGRLHGFVFRAGKLIVPVCILMGALNTLTLDGSHSMLSVMGQWVTPLFAPMGIQPDNWPATVGLVTGVLAKEVVVGTLNTLYAGIGHFTSNADIYGYMYQQFDGRIGAFAYLLFVLLYFPCVSTMAVMLRELHRGWTVFSAVWMTGVAYGVSVLFYQLATFMRHPLTSSFAVAMVLGFFFTSIILIKQFAKRGERTLILQPAKDAI